MCSGSCRECPKQLSHLNIKIWSYFWYHQYCRFILGNFGTVFIDQSYWQSSVAAKPRHGIWGFISGGLSWFAMPFCLATTMGLAYIALSTYYNKPLITPQEIDEGLVAPVVAEKLLGAEGSMLMTFMILMAIMSTGSAEVIAVTSIIIYDIYQIHLKPYRRVLDANECILCGKQRGRMANPRDKCMCIAMANCSDCENDNQQKILQKRQALKPDYKCKVHGSFRKYTDYLSTLKDWSMIWTSLAIFPLTIILNAMQISLSWVYLSMGILIGAAVIPVTLTVLWSRCTASGAVIGSLSGSVMGVIVWLSIASSYDGGLYTFIINTGREMPMLYGNLVSIVGGGVICIVVSFVTSRNMDSTQRDEVWEKTRDIDNPLSPWPAMYARELKLTGIQRLDNRPSLQDVETTFKVDKYVAYGASLIGSLILVVIWPAIMTSIEVMNISHFTHWINLTKALAWSATAFLIVVPLGCEVWELHKNYQRRKIDVLEMMPSKKESVPQKLATRKNVVIPVVECEDVDDNNTVDTVVLDDTSTTGNGVANVSA